MMIIALTGAKGSGKDTVADLLIAQYQSQWKTVHRLAFADPIKRMVQHIFKLDNRTNEQYDKFKRSTLDVFDTDKIMCSVEGRHVVREIGMMMRNYNEKQFNDYIEERLTSVAFTTNQVFVITDLRFDNEYTLLRRWGAKIIKVDRPGYEYDGHITERGFDDHLVDYVINNDGTMNDLTDAVQDLIIKMNKEHK
jgi:hypothetical protein